MKTTVSSELCVATGKVLVSALHLKAGGLLYHDKIRLKLKAEVQKMSQDSL